MTQENELAARIRQSVQGCTVHLHGPIQAWLAIVEAVQKDGANLEEIKKLVIDASNARIRELKSAGVSEEDPRIIKEETTKAFLEKLLS